MRDRRGRRRRARPLWVRELDHRQLHALVGKMHRQRWEGGLTDRQEWLWDQCMVDLAWRRSHALGLRKCTCWFCVGASYLEDQEPELSPEVSEQ